MVGDTRPVSWIKAARKDFEDFPAGAQDEMLRALTIVAEGGHPDIAKPLKGFGSGILELALWFCPGSVDTAVKGWRDTRLGFRPVSAEPPRGCQGCS